MALAQVDIGPTVLRSTEELRALVETYYDIQKLRVMGSNRKSALERGNLDAEYVSLAVSDLKQIETNIAKQLAKVIVGLPAADWLTSLRGVGPVMAAAVLASGLDPEIDKPSAWWRFAGVGIVDGKNQRLRKGEKRSYNGFLRRTLEVLVSGFIKSHREDKPAFYAELYYRFKEESIRDRPEIEQPIHHHRRAIMLTQRVFLTHLQQRWREALGLGPARELYIVEKEPGVHEAIPAP